MPAGNQEYIRDMNRHLVLETLMNHPPMSRAALAKKLKLTKATISTIVQDLLDKQLVVELGSMDTALGRKPILLDIHAKCGYVLSVNLGVENLLLMISDLKGHDCQVKEYPLDTSLDLIEQLKEILHHTIEQLSPRPYGVIGISIGIYGVVCNGTVLFTPYYKLRYHNLGSLLSEEFGIPVFVENEANLSALGEYAFSYDSSNMIFINIHDGIGMGILMNGQIYTGHNGYAGEFGHTILFPNGKPCPCGNRGCLEQYASEKALLENYAHRKFLDSSTISDFLKAYNSGDEDALYIIHNFVHYMSISMNTILHTFNPDLIVINSVFTNEIPGILDEIQSHIQNRLRWYLHIVPSHLQDTAALMGGICICTKKFLGIEKFQRTSLDS